MAALTLFMVSPASALDQTAVSALGFHSCQVLSAAGWMSFFSFVVPPAFLCRPTCFPLSSRLLSFVVPPAFICRGSDACEAFSGPSFEVDFSSVSNDVQLFCRLFFHAFKFSFCSGVVVLFS